MWDFTLGDAFTAMRRTFPFILFRMFIYFGIALFYVITTGTGAGIGYGLSSFGDGEGAGAWWGAFIGFGGASGILYWGREYILYLVKAGHIAVLVHHHDGKELPAGRGQIEYAGTVVKDRFVQASLLFGLDQLIKGVLKVLTGTLQALSLALPIPAVAYLMKFINAVLRMSLTYVDEIIIAQIIRTESENAWGTAKDALVLYAQNYGTFVKNAIWLSIFMWLITIGIFLAFLGPALALVATMPGNVGFWGMVIAFIAAWSLKAALLEPVSIYALMQVYFKVIDGQQPDSEWANKLSQASDQFREIENKAASGAAG